jgi:cell division protein FtsI/penicillin-binding protein 2
MAGDAAARLAPVLGLTPSELIDQVDLEAEGDYVVDPQMTFESGLEIAQMGIPGVKAQRSSRRVYPEGDLASNILGFIGRDQVGLTGVEADFERQLGGVPGEMLFERDVYGRPIAFALREIAPAAEGDDVQLTIDRYIQQLAEAELDSTIKAQNATGGQIVVMDPHTGEILALASRPSYQLSELDLSDPKQAALYRNRAVTDTYEPGSVFKVITMAAGIDAGVVTPDTTYLDTGILRIGDWQIQNWDGSHHDLTTMTQVLQLSLNTGSAFVSSQLGSHAFYDYVERFGFAQPTGVELAGEATGSVRTPGFDTWSPVDLATNSFGQGLSATPLQVLSAVSVIANGGHLMQPHILKQVIGTAGRMYVEPVTVRRVISPASARTVARMMNAVVDGQYTRAQVPGFQTSGKSGTAGIPVPNGYNTKKSIASFAGFGPTEDPVVAVLVKIDEPDEEYGMVVAAPVFSRLMSKILPYLGATPEGPALVEVAANDD